MTNDFRPEAAAVPAAASGYATRIYVDRASRQPLPLSPSLRFFAELA